MSFADFEVAFGATYETYFFYNGQVELKFDKAKHEYLLLGPDGDLIPLTSVSQICKIIDKSQALVPWACKMMSQAIFRDIPKTITKSGVEAVIMPYGDFEKIVMECKGAHKVKLDDAGNVGHATHDWIEHFINAVLNTDAPSLHLQLLSQMPHDERAASGCRAALDWMRRHNVRWLSTEQKIYSREFQYPGTLDARALTDSCDDPACCPHAFRDRLSLIDWKTSNHLYDEYVMQVAAYRYADHEENGTNYDDAWIVRLGKEDAAFDPWHLDLEILEEGWRAFRSAHNLTNDLHALETSQKARKAAISVIKKEQAVVAREARLKIACAYSSKFKGSKYPSCGPCETCLQIYLDKQIDKKLGWMWLESPHKQLGAGEPTPTPTATEVVMERRFQGLLDALAS